MSFCDQCKREANPLMYIVGEGKYCMKCAEERDKSRWSDAELRERLKQCLAHLQRDVEGGITRKETEKALRLVEEALKIVGQ